MYDDDNSMDFQLIYNQHVVTYNKFRGVNKMGIIAPLVNYINKQLFTNMKILKKP